MWNGLRRCGVGTGGSSLWVELVRRIVLLGSKEILGNWGVVLCTHGRVPAPFFAMWGRLDGGRMIWGCCGVAALGLGVFLFGTSG